ncbi:recombinase family protein [Chelatococcus sp.]|uniref:recombinase family protein n=2 Tax=Chelatococcus TaxID=28209 RepID=UPI0025BF494A|nr:recombinase family protein [Chelatococcus sp.]
MPDANMPTSESKQNERTKLMGQASRHAAIYARFSSDLQKDRSIDDQISLARAYCSRNGLSVVREYSDRARSGASLFGREGLEALMRDAKGGLFDVVVVEALDRLSRDQEDLAGIWKRLRFIGVEVVAVHEGTADAVQIGVRGLLGSLFLADLAHKVRRGQSGIVREGRHAGGKAYGYRPVAGKPGEMEIVPDEADVVRRIFTEYAGGRTPRDIAAGLNRDRIAPPRGQVWNASTINGNMARGYGIILNDIYAGKLVWNRVRMIKDPDTGKRVSRPNPESEWLTADVPHLRIVEQDLVDVARTRKLKRSHTPASHRQKPKHLLSGLLKCGECGSGMRVHDKDRGRLRVRCSRHVESGSCTNGRRYYADIIEKTVVEGLRDEMRDPQVIAEYVATFHAEMKRLSASSRRNRSAIERKLGETKRAMDRIIDAIADGSVPAAMVSDRLRDLEADKRRFEADLALADQEDQVIALHPGVLSRYGQHLDDLAASLATSLRDDEAGLEAFRSLVDSVVVQPSRPGENLTVDIKGRLSALLERDVFPSVRVAGVQMVAEEGLEPPTRGL